MRASGARPRSGNGSATGRRSSATKGLDPEGAHLAALERVVDFTGARVLEVGCGDGRLTIPVAERAAKVLAFDPDEEAIAAARAALPAELGDRVEYLVASATAIEIPRAEHDILLFSWSL